MTINYWKCRILKILSKPLPNKQLLKDLPKLSNLKQNQNLTNFKAIFQTVNKNSLGKDGIPIRYHKQFYQLVKMIF